MRVRHGIGKVAALAAVVVTTASCTLLGSNDNSGGGGDVTLVTHESWAVPQQLLDDFKNRSGITIHVIKEGDAGALTNKLVLTKANPIADVAYGVDSTFATRALAEGVFAPYAGQEATHGPQRFGIDPQNRLSAVDTGDVCVNIDPAALAAKGLPEPATLDDLADPKYKDQLVIPSPATSSPGLAFLLSTVAKYGERGWPDYWRKLTANGVRTVSGWSEAYSQDFSGSAGKGPRPIVISYASSPAAELGSDGAPRTKALGDTCYRQVEYAGVLAGAKQPDKAGKVVDFLQSNEFQATVAENMYVYPARDGVPLPAGWAQTAPPPQHPAQLPGDQVQAGREQWIQQWRALTGG